MSVDELNEQIQRAALERFGLIAGRKDYNLDRVVRLTAIATGCELAAFSVGDHRQQHYVATFGADLGTLPEEYSVCHRVFASGESLFADDLSRHPELGGHPAVAGPMAIRAYIGVPVYAATKTVIGTLCVASEQTRQMDTPLYRRVMTDCVRLIEDSLMMRSVAVRDPLTGLYNRRFFAEQISNEWRRAMRLQLPITIFVVDIDFFKAYNDSCGHLEGDKAIQKVASAIESCVGRAGDTVCRFGGEEFAMILPTTDQENGLMLAEKVRLAVQAQAIRHPGHPQGPDQVMTISIGLATISSKADLVHYSANDLIAKADEGLYEAKRAGRNCVRVCEVPSTSSQSTNLKI